MAHFIYLLRLVPRLHHDDAWTDADRAIIGRHFAHLQSAAAAGQVILAGRTVREGDQTFGLVVFTSADESAARAFLLTDPAVAEGVMTAELHPFRVALLRG